MYIEKSRKKWDFNSAAIIAVLGLIFFAEYYIFVFIFLKKLVAITTVLGIFLLMDIHFFVIMMIWSYVKIVTTGPGYLKHSINDNFSEVEQIKNRQKLVLKYKFAKSNPRAAQDIQDHEKEVTDPESLQKNEKLKKIAEDPILQLPEIGYCFKCEQVKLPRTHHCKQCGKCVLRMDHHCPWVGNCVGFYNHKFFILFLGYAALCLFQVFFWELIFYFRNTLDYAKDLDMTERTVIQINAMTSVALGTAVLFLGGLHVYMARQNVTTVEFHIKDIIPRNPFNKGVTKNLEEVFGIDRSTWLLPIPPRMRREDELFLLQEL